MSEIRYAITELPAENCYLRIKRFWFYIICRWYIWLFFICLILLYFKKFWDEFLERDKFLVIIYELCLSIAAFYLMYYFHECGHFIAAKISGFKKITVGYTNRYFLKVPNEVNLDAKEISTIKHKKLNYSALKDGDSNFNLIVF